MSTRIQRQRTKGWRMPEGAIYVGRPSRWGNPFPFDSPITMAAASVFEMGAATRRASVVLYRAWLQGSPRIETRHRPTVHFTEGSKGGMVWIEGVGVDRLPLRPDLEPLRGHDLACWCPLDQPCHADVLLELANG